MAYVSNTSGPYRITTELPPHLREWQLPPQWEWGAEGVAGEHRHYQEIIDALGRSLALVTVPDPAHREWLVAEARALAHRGHSAVPTTYHYWAPHSDGKRGPGYLRRWIAGETIGARIARLGAEDVPWTLQMLRTAGSGLAYVHDNGATHGAVSPHTLWVGPTGRLWMLGWQWALPRSDIPAGLSPSRDAHLFPPEWVKGGWAPTPFSDQWQLAAVAYLALTGETPPSSDVPPIQLLKPETPNGVAEALDRALHRDPMARHASVASFLRAMDRVSVHGRGIVVTRTSDSEINAPDESEEARLRWATADDYDVLASLGAGTFGSVWRVRDLTLEREVALKMLHPHVAKDSQSIARFRREARLAAQLAHPAIVPIYDWDGRGDVQWYTMELAEGGSIADLVARQGPRPLAEVAPQVESILDGLVAAHAVGVVHRDLKPENILIDRYRRWRITDFGIAQVSGEDKISTTGTPAFAAPEQLLGEAQGSAVDCFAVAAIVAFVLTGKPPFGEKDPQVILANQLARQTVSFDEMPRDVREWLEKGLNPDAEQRYPDASAMLAAWRKAMRSLRRTQGRVGWLKRLLRSSGSFEAVPVRNTGS